jgi:hypothetical protein
MAKELTTIDLSILPIETLAEMANEKAELVEKNARKTVSDAIDCGRYLAAIKDQIEHGKWAAWLGANWNYSQVTAWRYMSLAAKSFTMKDLGNAKNVNDALRMIAEDKDEKPTPRAARIPDRVEVVESASEPDDHSGDANKMVDKQPDTDPTPDPPTIRKTAKGSEKVTEDKKPRTQPIVPEVLADDDMEIAKVDPVAEWIDNHSLSEIVGRIVEKIEDDKAKKLAAKQLRKLADKLDPPTKFTRPDLEEVSAYFAELKASGPESFFDFYESKGWLVGKVSMKDWRASARKWVRENESNPFGGTGNGNGKRTAANADPESYVFSAEALGRGGEHS